MKAIAITPGTPGVRIIDRPEPSITADDHVKMRVLRVGICGTDREEAEGGRSLLPSGASQLVIGHEMFGEVVETGASVTRVKKGDFGMFTVRRGCSKCLPCHMDRPDMCRTGDFRERGIWGLDGYQTEFVVDSEKWVIRVPPELKDIGVLAEPISVLEKAIDESVKIQFARLPDAQGSPMFLNARRCLVTGLGPIGLLASLILRLRGAAVWGLDVVEPGSARPRWLEHIGGTYVDGRNFDPVHLDAKVGPFDCIVEATGVPKLSFNLLDAVASDGIIALTGIPGGERPSEIPGAELIRAVVLKNILMFGSVNAARDHFQMGVDDLALAQLRWGDHVSRLITHHYPLADAPQALAHHTADEIKAVIEWV